jgi:hypothetical protein
MAMEQIEERNRTVSIIVIILLVIAIAVAVIASRMYSTSNARENAAAENKKLEESIATTRDGYKYTNTELDFSIDYPKTFEATTTDDTSYFVNPGWRLGSESGAGRHIISIIKKGSNGDLLAELRIGISTSTEDVTSCTKIEDQELASSTVINGLPFMGFENSGGGMSHFIEAKSYRIVHNNTCLNIDTLVSGINIEVYGDPDRKPPFDIKKAGQELDTIFHTFKFVYFRQFSALFSDY